jgi:site-specific DNA recombinase
MRAAGYARISKDDTLEGRGVARQTEDIESVCQRSGWELIEVVTDNDVSASRYSRKPRPGYTRLLQLIETGVVQRAVVYDADRLLRQPKELEYLIDLAERIGGFEIHTVTGQVDLVSSSGRFIARSLVAKAAMESDDMSRRLKRANDQAAKEGRPRGTRAFGYETDGVTIRESEAELIRQAAADVLAGESWHGIVRRWNELGVLTPQRGVPWKPTVVAKVLTGPRAAGLRQHRGEIIGPAVWPAILDRATHDALRRRTNPFTRRRPPRVTPFTGLIRTVDGRMMFRNVQRTRSIYRPEAGDLIINAEPLEALIVIMLMEAVDSGRLAKAQSKRRRARRRPSKYEDPAIVEAEMRVLAADVGAGRMTRGEWLEMRGPLEDRLQRALAAAAHDDGPLAHIDVPGLKESFPGLTVDRQRAVLAAVLERVEILPSSRRGGPAPMVEGLGRIELERVNPIWRV